jgi:hypothetical protein
VNKEQLQELFYEPAVKLVTQLEANIDLLDIEQQILLEKLKFSLKLYQLKQAQKEQAKYDFEGFFKNI